MDVQAVVDELTAAEPAFHRAGDGQDVSYAASRGLLALLARTAGPGAVTLETGAGASTVVLLAAGAQHTAISPAAHEPERIRGWCDDHGIDTSGYRHLAGRSQDVLPGLDTPPLDLLLIDGDHAFPIPALDWFYGTRRLRAGGTVVVDDLQLWPCRIVAEFLDDEDGWERIHADDRFAAYRAQRPGTELTSRWWGQQGHVLRMAEWRTWRGRLRRLRRLVRGGR